MGVYAKENWEDLAEDLGFHHWHPPDGETFRLLLSRLDSNLWRYCNFLQITDFPYLLWSLSGAESEGTVKATLRP
jgi:hypothetical protein